MSKRNERNQEFNNDSRYEDRERNNREPKQIKPVIEDDRNKTKPNYVGKDAQNSQYKEPRQT